MTSDLRIAAERHPGPAAAAMAVVGAFVGAMAIARQARVLAYVVIFVVVAAIVARADRGARLTRRVWWGFSLLTLLHLTGGLLPSPDATAPMLYETWLIDGTVKFDQAVHLYGIALVAVGLSQIHQHRSGWWILGAAMAVGLGNEVVEVALDRALPTNVGDLENAVWDMVFNLAGAVIAVILVRPRVGPIVGEHVAATPS